jgi:hypothetical protein
VEGGRMWGKGIIETIPGMGRGIKENDGGSEFKYDILDIV